MLTFSVKKIGGKEYLYARESIYITKGVTLPKNKSLGRVDSSTGKFKKELAFKEEVKREEISARTKYWTNRVKTKKSFTNKVIQKIEALRGNLYRQKQELGSLGKHAMESAFVIDFIYNSNKIEGSKVPREQIEKIVNTATTKRNAEVENSIKALEESKNTIEKINIGKLVKLHKILLQHEPAKHNLREEPIVVGNEETAPFEEIENRLEELFEWYAKNKHKIYPPDLAFTFYYRFERIHPFIDGNGRTGRLLMNAILKEHKYHPIILWNSQWEAHKNAFKNGMEGQTHKYMNFMIEQFEKTYKTYLKRLDEVTSIEKQLSNFLAPSDN
ncbi:Fic family protein [Candidatus Peregrinibacteria bacterium]|nr:MAG: Fic family protein [Candidatus Peregrinibacteria bacterium]